MFKILRSQAKVFYWIIAASFILFGVVFSYGGATSGCQKKGPGNHRQAGVVGKINGVAITSQQFESMNGRILDYTRKQNQNRELNANQYASAREQAWNQLLNQVLLNEDIKKHGIKVTDEELKARFEQNPPPALLANYRDPKTGVVDKAKYFADLQNPNNDWSGPEAYVRQIMETEKLQAILAADVAVSDDEVRNEYLAQTAKAVAEYLGVLYADLASEYEPTDEEINQYYLDNPDEYQRQEKAQCQVVRFAKEPSESDWESAKQEISEYRADIENGTISFEDAAKRYSEDGSAARGGDLGTFDRTRMVPEFTEVAFSLPVGEISQPVKTPYGYHLIEVTEQHKDKDTGEVFEISARHILLKVVPGNRTLGILGDAAKDFVERVDGSNFVSTAQAEALDLVTPAPFIKGRDIPGMPLTLNGALWAHRAKPGDVSTVFENKDFFYVVLAGEKIPAGVAPLDEVKSQVVLALKKDNNKKLAKAKLDPAVGEVQMGSSMEEVATKFELKHAVTDTFTYNGNVADVGFGTDFNKKAIAGEVGVLIPEVETLRGLFALTPLWISPFDQVDFDARKDGIRATLLNRAQNKVVDDYFKQQLKEADIEDYR